MTNPNWHAALRLLGCAVLLAAVGRASAQNLTLDFRGGKGEDAKFNWDGPNAKDFATFEDQGMRWRFTGGNAPRKPVGISWSANAKSDFTATAHYEILQEDRPDKGNGVGVEMYLTLDTPEPRDGVAYSRLMRPSDGPMVVFNYMTNGKDGARISDKPARAPTTSRTKQGKLRLSREGKMLIASIAEKDQDFTEVHRREIGDVKVRKVRFAAMDGGYANAELDVRLLEFSLVGKALGLDGKIAITPPPAPTDLLTDSGGGRWAFWTVLAVAVVALGVFALVGLLVMMSKLRKPAQLAAKQKSSMPAETEPKPTAETIPLQCSCGKALKVKRSAVGKSVKCPACGLSIRVPTIQNELEA